MASLSPNSFSSFPVFCTLSISAIIFGTAVIAVPAAALSLGDPNRNIALCLVKFQHWRVQTPPELLLWAFANLFGFAHEGFVIYQYYLLLNYDI